MNQAKIETIPQELLTAVVDDVLDIAGYTRQFLPQKIVSP
jgi:hypothetical protein